MEVGVFAVLTKVDVAKRQVTGIATEEVVDHSGEAMDYETSVPYFKEWSQSTHEISKGKSLGNLRSMHTSIAAGKLSAINYNDAAKQISITADVIDDQEWRKVQEGVLNGFSIGGSYIKRWTDAGMRKFTAKPVEISLVDRPCCPTAIFSAIKSQEFEVVKEDGSTEMRKFNQAPTEQIESLRNEIPHIDYDVLAKKVAKHIVKKTAIKKAVGDENLPASAFAIVGDPAKPETWAMPLKLADKDARRKAIRKALSMIGNPRLEIVRKLDPGMVAAALAAIAAAAAEEEIPHGDAYESIITEDFDTRVERVAAARGLSKDLYAVGQFADMLQTLSYLYRSAVYEADIEQDGSAIPAELFSHLDELAETFLSMCEEEVNELTASAAAKGETLMNAEDQLKTFRKNTLNTFKKAAMSGKAMAKEHSGMAAMHDKMAAMCGMEKAADMQNMVDKTGQFHKDMADSHRNMASMAKGGADMAEKMVEACGEDEAVAKAAFDSLEKMSNEDIDLSKKAPEHADIPSLIKAALAEQGPAVMAKMVADYRESAEGKAEFAKAVDAAIKKQVDETLLPTNVTAVPRAGEATPVAKSEPTIFSKADVVAVDANRNGFLD